MRIVRSAAFLMWKCGGDHCTNVLLFCNSSFNAVGYSLSIMFNFGACHAVSDVSHIPSYVCNMSLSLIFLMGSANTVVVSYSISM